MLTPSPPESKTAIFRRMLTPPALAGLFRHSVAWFLASLGVLFIAAPFTAGMVEALTGTLFMAVLVARLVSLHTSLASLPSGSENADSSQKL